MFKTALHWTHSYAYNAVQRRMNADKFIQVGKSPYTVIYKNDITSVRHYLPLDEKFITVGNQEIPVATQRHRIPLVLVPPLGVYSWIFDLLVTRSLIRYLLARGYDLYLIDWGSPERTHAHISLKDYTLNWMPGAIAAIREHSQTQEVSLMGYCMGGLLALIYGASSNDQQIKNIVTIASPIDFRRNGVIGAVTTFFSKPLKAIDKLTNHKKLKSAKSKFLHLDGDQLSFLFKMSNPLSTVSSYINLVKNMADREYVTMHMSMGEWFNNMPAYPGATVNEVVRKFGVDNQIAKGEIKLDRHTIGKFSKIDSNLLAFAGNNDKIVSIDAARSLLDIVASKDKSFHIVPGGHAGVFAGSKATTTTWAMSADWLASRSA